jgi:hypothetical protein
MASGHVNRANRPNTWLHRPSCKREEKPCQLGAVHTWHDPEVLLRRVLLTGENRKHVLDVSLSGHDLDRT